MGDHEYESSVSGYETDGFQSVEPQTFSGSHQASGSESGSTFQRKSYPRRDANKPPRDFEADPAYLYKACFITGNKEFPQELAQEVANIRDILIKNHIVVRTSEDTQEKRPVDKIVQKGTWKWVEVILPWKDFNEHKSGLAFASDEAKWLSRKFNPYWDKIKDHPKVKAIEKFQACNLRMVMGHNLKAAARAGVIWSKDGCEHYRDKTRETGDMAFLLAVCAEMDIPVFNLAKPDAKARLLRYFKIESI